jgi:hypothetical protein
MHLTHVTLTLTHAADDVEQQSKIIKTKTPLDKNNHDLLSYIFNENVKNDSAKITLKPVKEAVFDATAAAHLVLVEMHNDALTIRKQYMPIENINGVNISKMCRGNRAISLFEERISFEGNDKTDSFLFGVDVTKANAADDKNTLLTHSDTYADFISESFRQEHDLSFNHAALHVIRRYKDNSDTDYDDITIVIFYAIGRVALIHRDREFGKMTDDMICNTTLYNYDRNVIATDTHRY